MACFAQVTTSLSADRFAENLQNKNKLVKIALGER
jgi:hypothetical protein